MADAVIFGVAFLDFALLMGWYVVHFERLDQRRREQLNRAYAAQALDQGRIARLPGAQAEH